jgi:hypothetical protein
LRSQLALVVLAAERELAVDDRAAQGALGVVVGRLNAFAFGETPDLAGGLISTEEAASIEVL